MIGQTISHYKILEKLGEGGMGIVYKARDTKLDRLVALKFLSARFTATEEERARFIQEAKAASSMNHPNVCTVHDILEHGNQVFIVMEFIDGVTLRDTKQVLSEKKILEITAQVADGLGAAHEKGIVHRDIKPENIMIRKDGIVQLMDFGLAKLHTPGNVSRITKVGTTMGTTGYMSPEQVQGLDVDHRTDIFSLGVVLYEMLAGESPFKGAHESAVMYEIVNVDPSPISAIKKEIDPEIDKIVLECLEKDKDERCQSARELARNLRKLKRGSSGSKASRVYEAVPIAGTEDAKGQRRLIKRFFPTASIFFVAILASVISWHLHPGSVKEVRKFQWPDEYSFCVLSPDGKKVAFSKEEKLWIRFFDKLDPIEVKNDEIVSDIIWSPNSDYIAYFTGLGTVANHELRKVSVTNADIALIVKTKGNYYPRFWGIDDSILVTTWDTTVNTLMKVPSTGGTLQPICGGDSALAQIKGNLTHVLGMPDGKTLLLSNYTLQARSEIILQTDGKRATIYSGPPESLIGEPAYSNTGHILFPLSTRSSSVPDLWAIPFNLSSLEVAGTPFLLARNADRLSVSKNGMLLYVDQGNGNTREQLVLLSRSGQMGRVISQPQLDIYFPAFAADGNTIATMSSEEGNIYNIWLHDITRGTKSQFSFDIPEVWGPSWAPDGKSIIFASGFYDRSDLYLQSTNGRTSAQPLSHTQHAGGAPSWSHGGRFIVYSRVESQPRTQSDLWYIELGKEDFPTKLFTSSFNESFPVVSPDDRFVAFQSDKSGQMEIYVTDFPKANQQWQVSFNGGDYPQWVGDELYFVNPRQNKLMTVKVKTNPDFQSENPKELISAITAGVQLQTGNGPKYAVSRDRKNILAVKNPMDPVKPKMVLVENWFEDYRAQK